MRQPNRFHPRVTSILQSIIWIVAFSEALVVQTSAQTNRGSITGVVTDAGGASVAGATVIVTNLGVNQSVTLITSESGSYTAASLDPVLYRVTVEANGFKKAVVDRIKVDTAGVTTVDVRLEVGGASEAITITADAPLVNRESGTTGQTITEQQIRDIPLNNRSVLDLALTVPNVSGSVGTEDPSVFTGFPGPGVGLNVNGGRSGETTILANGVNNTGLSFSRAVVTFTPDVVQEFTVQTSAYSAEYGQTGGGVINTTTKSGTNQYRGAAYWYNRNPIFNAAPYTIAAVNRPSDARRQNNFGAMLGGPIRLPKKVFGPLGYDGRDKSFFFAAFEPRWYSDSTTADYLLPTEAMRGGDFSNAVNTPHGLTTRAIAQQFNVPINSEALLFQQFNLVGNQLQRIIPGPGQTYNRFAGNIIPASFFDSTSVKLMNDYLPKAGDYFLNTAGQLRNFFTNRYVVSNEKRLTMRFDQNLGPQDKLNFNFVRVPIVGDRGRVGGLSALMADFSASKQFLLGETHIFSPTRINDLRLNYTRGDYSRANPAEFRTRNLSTELGLPSMSSAGLPLFQTNPFNIGQENIGQLQNVIEENFNIADTFSWTRGSMSWKFGADLRHQRMTTIKVAETTGGSYAFATNQTNDGATSATGGSGFASFLLGVPNGVALRSAVIPYYYRWSSANLFAQNDWKVLPNLTLNLGLRYSLQLPRTEKYNRQGALRTDLAIEQAIPSTVIDGAGNVVALPPGLLPTMAKIPVFAYSGVAGRSRYLTPIDKNGWEPRLGFAWSPRLFGLNRGSHASVVRGGFGVSHVPLTGLDRDPRPDFATSGLQSFNANSGQMDPNFALRLASNPPNLLPLTAELRNVPADGLLTLGSLALGSSSFEVDPNFRIPYVQNWNLSISYELSRSMVIEAAYVGARGVQLFLPATNINPRSASAVETLLANNLDPDLGVRDPLGRSNSVPLASLFTTYLGFNNLERRYGTGAASIRHAGYVSVQRRFTNGLAFTANYTYGKSLDNASDNGNAAQVTGIVDSRGQYGYGDPLNWDRAVSTFDIKHSINTTYTWELPFGAGRKFLSGAGGFLDTLIGGWQFSGVTRFHSGSPFMVVLADTNRLGTGGTASAVRPDLVQGVSVLNDKYDRNCPVGPSCEPFFNPMAFTRPVKGQTGTSPRTFDEARPPMRRLFDGSLQKNFRIFGKDSSRYLQFRADIINVFNHPNFFVNRNAAATRFLTGLPNENDISPAEYNAWAAVNGQPLQPVLANGQVNGAVVPTYRKVLDVTQGARGVTAPANVAGVLPADFYAGVRIPQGFRTSNLNSFDITTPAGLKLYRTRQVYNQDFGAFEVLNTTAPRVIQFALKIYF